MAWQVLVHDRTGAVVSDYQLEVHTEFDTEREALIWHDGYAAADLEPNRDVLGICENFLPNPDARIANAVREFQRDI